MEKWINNYKGYKDYDLYKILEKNTSKWVERFIDVPRDVVIKLQKFSGYMDCQDITPYTNKEIENGENEYEGTHGMPMWNTYWAFSEQADIDWLCDVNNQKLVKKCGFAIFESEDYGYILAIDGMGYSFMHEHFIPLYLARGLKWHEWDEEWQKITQKYRKEEKENGL